MIIITIKRLVEKGKEPASLQQTDFNLKRAKQAQKKKTKKMVHNKRDKIKGVVENVEVISASPKGYFEDSALTMVSSWSFQPAKYGGKPIVCFP